MTLELIPMLLLSLLLLASDGADAGVARLVLSGDHRFGDSRQALIVGDATATIPRDATLTAPVHVLGGTTRIDGVVRARVTQISGTLIVGPNAEIADLRLIGGSQTVAGTADITRRTRVDLVTDGRSPWGAVLPSVATIAVLSLIGLRLVRTRPRNLDNVARAVAHHPVITATVGLLLMLTALSLLVFMAFTLVLIPVSLLGLAAGVVVTSLGVIGWGHRLGRHLPLRRPDAATAAGVVVALILLEVAGRIPVAGDLIVGFVLLSGVGAVTITYLGFAEFRPAALPD